MGVDAKVLLPGRAVDGSPPEEWCLPLYAPTMTDVRSIVHSIRRFDPDIIHTHSSFQPITAIAAMYCRRYGVPYIAQPRGALSRESLALSAGRKRAYLHAIEIPLLRRASAVIALTKGDNADICRLLLPGSVDVAIIPNPADPALLSGVSWSFEENERRLRYLGRFDVLHKGIDRYWELAHALPTFRVHLTGAPPIRRREMFETLIAAQPDNVILETPVFGTAKASLLAHCRAYVHLARWEAFGNAIVEALSVGTPVALAQGQYLATELAGTGAVEVMNPNSPDRYARLGKWLEDERALTEQSESARRFAKANFDPVIVARQVLDLYRTCLPRA